MNTSRLIALVAAATLATVRIFADAPQTLVVWNGEDANRGGGWASPEKDANFIKAQTEVARSGDTALEIHLEGERWLGGGWNWQNWWPENSGTDTTD